MEQIVLELSPFTRRSGSLAISHVAHSLSRGLEVGEHVLVHDSGTDDHFTAAVADVHFELEDTSYRLEIGTRITASEAAEWVAPAPVLERDRLTTRDMIDLLAQLRRSERDVTEALADLRVR